MCQSYVYRYFASPSCVGEWPLKNCACFFLICKAREFFHILNIPTFFTLRHLKRTFASCWFCMVCEISRTVNFWREKVGWDLDTQSDAVKIWWSFDEFWWALPKHSGSKDTNGVVIRKVSVMLLLYTLSNEAARSMKRTWRCSALRRCTWKPQMG